MLSTVLTGLGVLLGVWRIHAHYEARNEAAHADLGRRIDSLGERLGERLDSLGERLGGRIDRLAADVAYLRGRQDERDRREA